LSNPEPVHKEHITDWIAVHTSIGETLKSYDLERLAAQATGNYVTVAYRIRLNWVGKDGADKPSTIRVIHTWLRDAGGKWQIIGHSSRCFQLVKRWVELKIRRHLRRARNRRGFGWREWSTERLYGAFGLFNGYHVRPALRQALRAHLVS
jgi:hypothetical protein